MIEFPALVYRSASVYLQVHSQAEHAAALKDGWFATVPEALAPRVESKTYADGTGATGTAPLPDRSPAEQRAELERQAAELGLQYSPLIGDAKLAERIAAAKAKG